MAEGFAGRQILRWLRVPPRPEPPYGSPGTLRIFNAASGFYRYRLTLWFFKQLGTLVGLITGLLFLDRIIGFDPVVVQVVIRMVELVGVVTFVAQLPVTYLMVGLDYRYRWYMVTDTSLRIREGLLRIREQTMTYANIQNLSIRQGPIQRFFGISDLRVRTAGGGEKAGSSDDLGSETANMHLGYFRGLDNAAEIRDLIMDRMRSLRDSGLGDPDEVFEPRLPTTDRAVVTDELLVAARELRDATRELRSSLD